MKKIFNILLFGFLVMFMTSCLKAGLDELETYDLNEITNIRFEYRWWDEAGSRLRVVEMNVDKSIDKDNKSVTCTINVPAATNTFTSEIREKVSLNNLAANLDISTAARVSPVGNAPTLGTPADFSAKEFIYQVVAGNGAKADWTIKILDLKK